MIFPVPSAYCLFAPCNFLVLELCAFILKCMHSSVWNILEDLRYHHLHIQLLLSPLHFMFICLRYVCGVFICVFSCMCRYMCMLLHVEAWDWCLASSSAVLRPIHWAMVSQLNPDLTNMASLASYLALWVSQISFPSSGITARPPYCPGTSMDSGELNSHSYGCFNSLLHPELFFPEDQNSWRAERAHLILSVSPSIPIKQRGIDK